MAVIKTNEDIFNKIYKAIAMLAIACVIAPISYFVFFQQLGINIFISFIISVCLLSIGYLIQSLFAKLTKVKRKPQDVAYESSTKYFNIKNAALSITICIVLSLIIFNIVTRYMKYRANVGIDYYYDQYSLYPYIALLIAAVIMILGVVMWFYPYNRIISVRSLFVYFVLFVIMAFTNTSMNILCMILFLLCALTLLNQNNIIQAINKTKIGVVTTRVRLYNAGTVLIFIGGVLCVLIIVASMLVGLSIVAQFLLYAILGIIFVDDGSGSRVDVIDSYEGNVSLSNTILGMQSSSIGVNALWYLFILIVIIAILCLIFIGRIKNIFKSIREFFGHLINNIVDLFMNIFFFFSLDVRKDTYEYVNYKDEELDVDKISAKLKMHEFDNKKYSYKDYTNKFNSLKTINEKYIFAYQTLVNCWSNMNFSLNKSDTPRQIKNKVIARTTIEEISEITQIFEEYRYGEVTADIEYDDATVQKISKMNKLIEKYYE